MEASGVYDHVVVLGDGREAMFVDDEDRRFFLPTTPGQFGELTWWRVLACGLISLDALTAIFQIAFPRSSRQALNPL